MKKLILVIAIGLLVNNGIAQNNPKLDSLNTELKKYEEEKKSSGSASYSRKDSAKSNLLDKIGEVYLKQNKFNEAKKNFEDALKIQKEINDKKGMAVSNHNLGRLHENMGVYQEALKYDLEALSAREDVGNNFETGKAFETVALDYENIHDNINTLTNYEKALKKYLLTDEKKYIARGYHNVGRSYLNYANTKKALDNEHKALTIAEQIGDTVLEKKINKSILEIDKKNKGY